MSAEKGIEVRQTPTFKKAFKRLTDPQKYRVDDEIGKIIDAPDIGTQKRGDLSHLWVHKFKMEGREVLLGYSCDEGVVVEVASLNYRSLPRVPMPLAGV